MFRLEIQENTRRLLGILDWNNFYSECWKNVGLFGVIGTTISLDRSSDNCPDKSLCRLQYDDH